MSPSQKEEAEKWKNRKNMNNETARKRMEKFNKKRKAEEAANKKPKKILTRQQSDIKKFNEAERKRRQRIGFTDERKEAIKARCRELYAIKNEKIKEKMLEEKQRELQEQEDHTCIKKLQEELQAKEAERDERLNALQEQTEQLQTTEAELIEENEELEARNNMLPEDEAIDTRSQNARRKALERVKSSLPRRRSQKIQTMIDLVNKSSPRKAAALKQAGIAPVNPLHEGIIEAGLAAPRKSAKRKHMAMALIVR